MTRRTRSRRQDPRTARAGLRRAGSQRRLDCRCSVVSGVGLARWAPIAIRTSQAVRLACDTRVLRGRPYKRECRERFGFSTAPGTRPSIEATSCRGRGRIRRASHTTRDAVETARRGMPRRRSRALGCPRARSPSTRGNLGSRRRSIRAPLRLGARSSGVRRRADGAAMQGALRLLDGELAQAVKRGDWSLGRARTADELLASGTTADRYTSSAAARGRAQEARCERCGLDEWRGEPLSLELHHVNGDGLDQPAREPQLLCPNCHSQTENYGGRNGAPARSGQDAEPSRAARLPVVMKPPAQG